MTLFRPTSFLAVVALALAALTAAPGALTAQAPSPAPVAAPAPSAVRADAPVQAGPRVAPRWEPASVLLPGQSQDREINAAVRRDTITIPVVTLLLGIIILILLVN